MPDRKIYLNGTSVPLYWTNKYLDDGSREYKLAKRCCYFDIKFEYDVVDGSVSTYGGQYSGYQYPFEGFISQYETISNYYRTISVSFRYYNSRTYSGTCACPPFEPPEDYIFEESGSGTYTVVEKTEDHETRFVIEDPQFPKTCSQDTSNCRRNIFTWFGNIESDTSRTSNSKSEDSFTNKSNCGSCTTTTKRDNAHSTTLSEPIPQSYLIAKALSNFNANTDTSNKTISGLVSVSFSNYYSQSFRFRGAKKYRLKFRKPPSCYLKVWLKETTQKADVIGSGGNPVWDAAVYEESERIIPKVLNFPTDDSDPQGDTDFITTEEFDITIPPFQEATENKPNIINGVWISVQKYSFIEGYEPDISDPDNRQPNGFPDPNWEPSPP
jgi:hypothetical protein